MKKGSFFLFGALVALYSLSCRKSPETPLVWPGQVSRAAEISQVMGWELFRQEQLAKPGQNVLLSPYSIQAAFSMALNGARGQTQEELQNFLGCRGCSPDTINIQHRYLNTLLTSHSGHPTLTVANRYFYDSKRIAVKASFLQTLEQYYQGGADALDFSAEQAALKHINGWVSHSTKGKIDRILDRITPLDVAFLINALHFKADWAKGFAPDLTQKSAFTRPDGSKVQVDFVNADRDYFFAATQQFNLIDIPFRDSTYSLSLLQAAVTNTDAQWHLNVTPSKWRTLYDSLRYGRAHVFFPKLQLTYENDLIKSMEAMGVKAPFSEREADFSLMGTSPTDKRIFINQVKHKVVLNVDEKGAEGAAVTSIGFGIDSMPPTFWFNKPFVLVLRHIPTNTILFLGYVADPSA